jgi:hypothetical protein
MNVTMELPAPIQGCTCDKDDENEIHREINNNNRFLLDRSFRPDHALQSSLFETGVLDKREENDRRLSLLSTFGTL